MAFTDKDFRWLDDMRLLAKCELAQRAGDRQRERRIQQDFFKRQPMLFEPDNAVNFNLLRYQENLRPAYRRTRNP